MVAHSELSAAVAVAAATLLGVGGPCAYAVLAINANALNSNRVFIVYTTFKSLYLTRGANVLVLLTIREARCPCICVLTYTNEKKNAGGPGLREKSGAAHHQETIGYRAASVSTAMRFTA